MMRASEVTSLRGVLAAGTELVPVISGFKFTEGPIWHPVERSLIFSDILGNSIFRWSEASELKTLRKNSYMANGNAYDQQGRVITCEHATSRITRTDFANGGDLEVLATHYQGKALNSPNDVVVSSAGAIYFTDPTSGRGAAYGVPRQPELPFSGVYRLEPQTKELTLLVEDFTFPNGLCFSPDEKRLYVNDTMCQHIRVFDVLADGMVTNGRVFARLEGTQPGVADGMKVDSAGHVFCCGPAGVHVFNALGEKLGLIETPEFAANFVFGGDDLRTLYITATTSIYSLRVQVPGISLFNREENV